MSAKERVETHSMCGDQTIYGMIVSRRSGMKAALLVFFKSLEFMGDSLMNDQLDNMTQ